MVADLVGSDEYQAGLAAGAAALVVALITVLVLRRSGRPALPGLAGGALVLAALLGLRIADDSALDDRLLGGLLVLAVGAFLTRALRWRAWVAPFVAAPGAGLVTTSGAVTDIDLSWVQPLTFLVIVLGAVLVPEFDRENARAGLGPVLLPVTALGMYTTLPDTEQALVLVGASLPLALLGWPKPLASLGAPGAAATVGLVVWTAAVGGRGRPGAIVGAMACLGVMLVEPVVLALFGRRRPAAPSSPLSSGVVVVAALHVALVLFVSLAAGREISARAAAAIAAIGLGAAALALAIIMGLRPRSRAADDRH